MSAEDVYPYATIAADPASEAIVAWIDDSDSADGTTHTLEYGTDESDLDQSVESDGDGVPAADAYKYEVSLSDLEPATTYHAEIDRGDDETVDGLTFETLPETLSEMELTIVLYSDIHIDRDNGMSESSDFTPVVDQNPDVLLVPGDTVTNGDEQTSEKADEWLRFWDDYYGQFDRLVPIFGTVGNHEVGNHGTSDDPWTGTEDVDPEAGYFQFWFSNPAELDPVGENYGSVLIGDGLRLLALDTHSAQPADVRPWLEDELDGSVALTIPFYHSPLLAAGDRTDDDPALQELLREEWARPLSDDGSVFATFNGHIHTRDESVSWTVVDEETDGDDYEDLGDDGYLVEGSDDPVIEWGSGYRDDRTLIDRWWLDRRSQNKQFYTLTVSRGSPMEMTVEERDETGSVTNQSTFESIEDFETQYSSYGRARTERIQPE